MSSQMLLGNLGGPELLLMAAIAVLLVGVSRLTRSQRIDSTGEKGGGAAAASSRAYIDRLVGAVQRPV
jgi:hypothetical protein